MAQTDTKPSDEIIELSSNEEKVTSHRHIDDNSLAPNEENVEENAEENEETKSTRLFRAPEGKSVDHLYVVGIGASAGGLDALERFFQNMSVDSGAAFVVVQHLSPDFKSLMAELLARYTKMDIYRVEDSMPLQANSIYLIPPRMNMVLKKGHLHLTEQDHTGALNLPIDIFFRSLAQDAAEYAIGIILSGTGSDGSRGLPDIHHAGGLTLVQDAESAAFDGMPRAAETTGFAHIITTPNEMPERIRTYLENGGRLPVDDDTLPREITEENELSVLFALLKRKFKIDFSYYKSSTIVRRIERRMALRHIYNSEDYIEYLRNSSEEVDTLYRDLLVEVTEFFRNPEAFSNLAKENVLGQIVKDATEREGDAIRVWVPGCATGEEAYSIAMLFQDIMEKQKKQVNVRIFATDVHQGSLDFASDGIYTESDVVGIPVEYQKRYLNKVINGYQINKQTRKMVIFAHHNLTADPPFTKIDLVTCRNVLIYFQLPAQNKVLSSFYFSLKKNGVLFLGPSEFIGDLAEEFEVFDSRWRIYKKIRDVRLPAAGYLPPVQSIGPSSLERTGRQRSTATNGLNDWYEDLLQVYLPPSILLDEQHNLLYTFGDAGRYLRLQGGKGTLNVLRMISGDLHTALRAALHRATKEKEPVVYTGINAKTVEGDKSLRVAVRPFVDGRHKTVRYIVELEELAIVRSEPAPEQTFDFQEESQERIIVLERELDYTKEHLQTTIEELETTNEELQSTNEELIASNEELQSTNEELHSVNEELYTVNGEYQRKIDELTQLTTDMKNLQESSRIGTIFLDKSLQIRDYTPASVESFNLLPQDIGRPVEHLLYNVNLASDELKELCNTVLEKNSTVEREIQIKDGTPMLMRILPYRDGNDATAGVVLTVVSIARIKKAEKELDRLNRQLSAANQELRQERDAINESLAESERRFRSLVENAGDMILVTDPGGKIIEANEQVCINLGYTRGELLGLALGDIDTDIDSSVIEHLQNSLKSGTPVTEQTMYQRKNGSSFPVETRSVKIDLDGSEVVLSLGRNITMRRMNEEAIKAVNQDLQRANSELERSNNELDRFVHIAAHDLKEPLRGLMNYAGMLNVSYHSILDEEGRGYLQSVKRLGVRMQMLIEDLRRYAKVGQDRRGNELVNLQEVIDEVYETLKTQITQNNVKINQITPFPKITYLRSHAMIIFQNLISNAIKYNESEEKLIELGIAEEFPQSTPSFVKNQLAIIAKADNEDKPLLSALDDALYNAVKNNVMNDNTVNDNTVNDNIVDDNATDENASKNIAVNNVIVNNVVVHNTVADNTVIDSTVADNRMIDGTVVDNALADSSLSDNTGGNKVEGSTVTDNTVTDNTITDSTVTADSTVVADNVIADNIVNSVTGDALSKSTSASYKMPTLFYISDNGIGIAERHREKIFEMFQRLHVDEDYGGGTGAGLALVKKILETHGGAIWVDENSKQGSIFYFYFYTHTTTAKAEAYNAE